MIKQEAPATDSESKVGALGIPSLSPLEEAWFAATSALGVTDTRDFIAPGATSRIPQNNKDHMHPHRDFGDGQRFSSPRKQVSGKWGKRDQPTGLSKHELSECRPSGSHIPDNWTPCNTFKCIR